MMQASDSRAVSVPSFSESLPPYMAGLNPAQVTAVQALDGPVLVLAGAGTGKTKTLTARLAHLLATGRAMPSQILAVTFTNKAAHEIRERVSHLLGRPVDGWYLGTFHALAARLLRPHAELVGLKPSFTIIGTDDQQRLIKQILSAENVDEKKTPPRSALGVIDRWKDRGLRPEDVKNEILSLADGKMPKIYAQYQERLRELNACDFGDLLLHQLTILRQHPDILAAFQNRFRYLLVDEYQDTNVSQYLWLRLLAQGHRNICCVGDEDQSIYGWRGAEIGNILRFEEDFPGAVVVRLEENYRSTGHILGAATSVIAQNRMRLGKTLWTASEMGEKIALRTLWDGEDEARWVADEIEALQRKGVSLRQIAVMVRAGFLTRAFEERFITLGIPYRVLVGARFYERQEIKDAMAYLRLIASPDDDLAFERIVNLPKRGVGPSTLQQLHEAARRMGASLVEATIRLCETDEIKPKLRATLSGLMEAFARWRGLLDTMPHTEVVQIMLDESGYTAMWQADKSPDAPARLDNLKELVSAMAAFDTLPAFLEHVALVLDVTDNANVDQVSLMTLHGAKGLEFEYVFLPGWEEELFPSRLSLAENGTAGLEEERRLAYVGITRARKRAFISHVANRFVHGSWVSALPSRFLEEIPDAHVERTSSLGARGGAAGGYGSSYRQTALRERDATPDRFGDSRYASRSSDDFDSSASGWERPPKDQGGCHITFGRAEKTPPLWRQIGADKKQPFGGSKGSLSSPRTPPTIEGCATEVAQAPRREGRPNIGDRVAHETFGLGTVRRVDNTKLDIAFDKGGMKKVMENFVTIVKS